MASTVLERLAALAISVRYEDLPPEVVSRTKALVLDSLGCMLGGYDSTATGCARRLAAELGGNPQARLIGSAGSTSMAMATFVNGTALRVLDANDYVFARDPAHPSGNLPPLIALAEGSHAGGRDFITAAVAAYEIHLRLAEAAGAPSLWQRGWHHSTNLALSSSLAGARLLGSDARVAAHAAAIAASHQNTLAQLQSGDVALMKGTAEAWAAKAAVEALLLARAGLTGPLQLMEGKNGWISTIAGEVDLDLLLAPIDGTYRLLKACTKPYSAVASAMAPIEAASTLHRQLPDGDIVTAVDRIEIGLPLFVLGTPAAGGNRRHPATPESAEHSLYFCTVLALATGSFTHEGLSPESLADARLAALLDKTSLHEDEELSANWPAAAGAVVTVHLRDGRVLRERCPFPPGHPAYPGTGLEAKAKLEYMAGDAVSAEACTALTAHVDALDRSQDLSDWTAALPVRACRTTVRRHT